MSETKVATEKKVDISKEEGLKFKDFLQTTGLIFILVGLVIFFSIFTFGKFITISNILNVLLQSSTRGIAAVGMAFVILTGGIDLSVAGMSTLIGCLGATMMARGVPMPIALLIMLALGCILGSLNGFSVARLGMAPFIVTLATWQVFNGIAYQFTGGGQTIFGLPKALAFFGQGYVLGIPVAAIIFAIIAFVAYLVLQHTTFGRQVYAVGGNEISAWLSGINVKRVKFMVYCIGGLCSSIAAILVLSRIMCASVTMTVGLEMDAIAAVVIGGISLVGGEGFLSGAVIGALIIGVINNGLNLMGVNPYIQNVAKGIIIFFAVLVDVIRKRK